MYKIALSSGQSLPEVHPIIMQLLTYPKLRAESKILICYFIRELIQNPTGTFQPYIFMRATGIKREVCFKALGELTSIHHIMDTYKEENGEIVYLLDWERLIAILRDNTIIIRPKFNRRKDDEQEDTDK